MGIWAKVRGRFGKGGAWWSKDAGNPGAVGAFPAGTGAGGAAGVRVGVGETDAVARIGGALLPALSG